MQLKYLLAALLCLFLLAAGNVKTFAAGLPPPYDEGDVVYFGSDTPAPNGAFVGVDVYGGQVQDFFGAAGKNFLPGDTRSIRVRLVNNSSNEATFYLKAASRTVDGYTAGQGDSDFNDSFDSGEGKSTSVEPYFPGKTASDGLLEAMKITMSFDGTEFYAGTLGGTPDSGSDTGPYITTWYTLGTLSPGESRYVEVALTLPIDSINEYKDALASVDWTFLATEGENVSPTPTPTVSPTPTVTPSPAEPIIPPSGPPLPPRPTSSPYRPPSSVLPSTLTATPTPTPTPTPTLTPSISLTPAEPNGAVNPDQTLSPSPSGSSGTNQAQPSLTPMFIENRGGEDITVVIPSNNLPKTGGMMNFALPMGIAALFILFLLLLLWRKDREERKKTEEGGR